MKIDFVNKITNGFKKTILIMTILSVSACAVTPEEIKPTYVSSNKYNRYDCMEIQKEINDISMREKELYSQVSKMEKRDAITLTVGIFLFFPALFFLNGNDNIAQKEYADLKGQHEILKNTAIEKGCSIKELESVDKSE